MKEYIVYSRQNCAFCTKLLNFMKEEDMKFAYITYYNLDDRLKNIMQRYKWRTVPLVLEIDNDTGEERFIGGCDDTINYLNTLKKGEKSE